MATRSNKSARPPKRNAKTRKPTPVKADRRSESPRSASGTAQAVNVASALAALREIAPLALAADWDNVGLLAGRPDWPAEQALLALDLTDDVAREALAAQANLLILYHPPIFKGVRRITPEAEAPTRLLPDLLAARVSMIALHTALDAAPGGTNDVLLDAFALEDRRPLELLKRDGTLYKLVVFVPDADVAALRGALAVAGAGVIGHYSECSFELPGRGTFRGDETTNPVIGQSGRLESVEESRLEMVVDRRRIGDVVRAIYANHKYEEPAFEFYPLHEVSGRGAVGMGRVGRLRAPTNGRRLIETLAARVSLVGARVTGELNRSFTHVVAAAGSYGTRSFTDPQTLYLTGEYKHHDALEMKRRGVTCVLLGHYESERPALESVRQRLAKLEPRIRARIAKTDRSPMLPL